VPLDSLSCALANAVLRPGPFFSVKKKHQPPQKAARKPNPGTESNPPAQHGEHKLAPQPENAPVSSGTEATSHEPSTTPAPESSAASRVEPAALATPSAGGGDSGGKASRPFPIVGIGASAGGLAALESFFSHIPADTESGMAFVIVQHLDPNHHSLLTELVRRYTRMQVFEVTDGMTVEPNCAYIIPPNTDLALGQGKLRLVPPIAPRGMRLPIDSFFRSLAQERGELAIGVVLSGNGTDGTLGLRAIKETAGIAMVQEPGTAEYDGMPRSAIASGLVDYVLPPAEMPGELIAYMERSFNIQKRPGAFTDAGGWVLKIMALLRTHTGHDFTNYKQSTVRRRIERRMAVNQIDSLENYLRHLRQKPVEMDTLFREILIGVTSFFRDPAAFTALRERVIPLVLGDRVPETPVRVWVPACSTGEEAYSLAMLFEEVLGNLGRDFPLQIFATDIDDRSIERARIGLYPASIAADVSPERLSRFFAQEEKDFYRVKKTLRDQVVFAEQDVLKDPPFSKLDLISCRNMLIYLESVLQKRLIPLFHYALAPGGFLFLGNSESVGEFTNLFNVTERKWKIYRRRDSSGIPLAVLRVPALPTIGERYQEAAVADLKDRKVSPKELAERLLLQDYAPACVAVNEQGEILYVHGRTGKYLEIASGEASLNLIRSAREGLKAELAHALRKVATHRRPVKCDGLEVRVNGGFQTVNVTVQFADGTQGISNLIVVTFEDAPKTSPAPSPAAVGQPDTAGPGDTARGSEEKDLRIAELERELRIKGETLQTTVEELETSNEELKSANEELQSTNEELQSTNEELETSKEELQSVNEELVTVNSELHQKIDGLSRANNDMNNLLAGTAIGMLFVDHQLRIQRFTPATTQIINLIQSDIGRPVGHLVLNLAGYDDLANDVKTVLDTLAPKEAEVQTRSGQWYLMRILPYRTLENVIEGAVLTFVEIAAQKQAEEKIRTLNAELEGRVRARTAELERVNKDLQKEISERKGVEARREIEITALTRLLDLGTQMMGTEGLPKLLEASVDAALELTRAKRGTLEIYDPASETLHLRVQRGFQSPFLEYFAARPGSVGSSMEAMRRRERVLAEDVRSSPLFEQASTREVLEAAGVRAVLSVPVLGPDGRLLAVLSTHWAEPLKPDDATLRLLDLLSRQVADLIEHHALAPGSA